MTRNRINIDVDTRLIKWLDLTAKIVGATRTETARALLTMMSENKPQHNEIVMLIEQYREQSNQSRSEAVAAYHSAQQRSAQTHRRQKQRQQD